MSIFMNFGRQTSETKIILHVTKNIVISPTAEYNISVLVLKSSQQNVSEPKRKVVFPFSVESEHKLRLLWD